MQVFFPDVFIGIGFIARGVKSIDPQHMSKVEVHLGKHAADVFHRHIGLCLEVAFVGHARIRIKRDLPA